MPPTRSTSVAPTEPSNRRPRRAIGSALAEDVKHAEAEGEAANRLLKMLEELREIGEKFEWLIDSFGREFALLVGELGCCPVDHYELDEPDAGDDEDGVASMTNPDRIALFLLGRSNAPATLSEIQKGTGIPISSIKNIFYVKAAKCRFVVVKGEGRHRWRLADVAAEEKRLRS
jgi:hypothetical protein